MSNFDETVEHQGNTTENQIQNELRKQKVAKLLKNAITMGAVRPGWSAIDYMRYAALHHGWESTCISGQKGTLKSNLLLQHGLALWGSLDKVFEHFVTDQDRLFDLIEYAIDNDVLLPWIGVDDIAMIFPKSLYFTKRRLYSELQASWEAVRTVFANFEFSCVIKRKVATFILEDITADIKCYKPVFLDHADGSSECIKSHYNYRRWLWLTNYKDPTQDIARLITVEEIPFPATPEALKYDPELKTGTFYSGGKVYKGEEFFRDHACLRGINTSDFKKYWDTRLGIAKKGFKRLQEIMAEEEVKKAQRQAKLSAEEKSSINRENALKRWHPEQVHIKESDLNL
jgi:hypothetical protein